MEVKEIVEKLSTEEKKLLLDTLRIEARYKQTMHDNLDRTIVQEIQNAIERAIQ